MKILYHTIFLLLIIQFTNGQSKIISKENVLKVFEKENETYKDWYSCNNEDAYLKSETIYLYDNADYYLQDWKCTQLIQLKFKTGKTFNETEFSFDNLQKKASLLVSGLYEIEVIAKNDSVFIHKYHDHKLVDKFYVKELNEILLNDKKYKSTQIKLIRIR